MHRLLTFKDFPLYHSHVAYSCTQQKTKQFRNVHNVCRLCNSSTDSFFFNFALPTVLKTIKCKN